MRFWLGLILIVYCVVSSVYSQNYDNVWVLGQRSAILPPENDTSKNNFYIDFKNDSFKLVKKYELQTEIMNDGTSICDSLGDLIMFTNGCAIYDSEGQIISNGDSINYLPDGGNNSWVSFCSEGEGYPRYRGTRFIPFFSLNRIFLLHTAFSDEFEVSYRYLLYTEIEFKNGVWKVTSKNNLLYDQAKTGIRYDITKHANGRDWWLVAHKMGDKEFLEWLITPEGINFQSNQSFQHPVPEDSLDPTFSPDGTKLVQHNLVGDSWIINFDRCTGTLSEPYKLPRPKGAWYWSQLAFSPNGCFIYFADSYHLYQIDLLDTDTLSNIETISVWDELSWPCDVGCYTDYNVLEPGPDGKIYGGAITMSKVVHVIERPNEKGKACMFRPRAYKTPFFIHGRLPAYPYYRLGPIDGSACDTLGINNVPVAKFRYYPDSVDWHKIEFVDNSYYNPTDWYWDFGDGSGNSSTEVNPVYSYAKSGVYDVCLTVSNAYGSDTYCRYVRVGTVSTTEPNAERYMKLYPNPATNSINIELGEKLSDGRAYTIHCYDLLGRRCYTGTLPAYSYLHTIDVSALAPGMYFIELTDGAGNMRGEKFVRE